MNENIEALRRYLQALTFAQVVYTVAKDSNLSSFKDVTGGTTYSEDPDFEDRRRQMSRSAWVKTEKSYSFYYGFVRARSGPIHFDSKGQANASEEYSGLGVFTKQNRLTPPNSGQWIVGSVVNPDRPHYFRWARCTEQESRFAEFMLSGKTSFTAGDLRRLFINRDISAGEVTNRLVNMAMILLAKDVDYYLDIRRRHGGKCVDAQVFGVCEKYDLKFWEEYKRRALEQSLDPVLKYSDLIPAPAPKPIVETRGNASDPEPVGINTPFADLKL